MTGLVRTELRPHTRLPPPILQARYQCARLLLRCLTPRTTPSFLEPFPAHPPQSKSQVSYVLPAPPCGDTPVPWSGTPQLVRYRSVPGGGAGGHSPGVSPATRTAPLCLWVLLLCEAAVNSEPHLPRRPLPPPSRRAACPPPQGAATPDREQTLAQQRSRAGGLSVWVRFLKQGCEAGLPEGKRCS